LTRTSFEFFQPELFKFDEFISNFDIHQYKIMSADYRTQSYKADTEAVDMWVGRLGFQTALTCPEKKGGVYFRASVLHDFDGDAETKFTGLKSGEIDTPWH
jgi:hypothetical protein